MKNLDIYEKKTVFIGIVLGVINLVEYIFRIIPNNSVGYWSLFFFVPLLALLVYIALCVEDHYSIYIQRTYNEDILEDQAYFSKLILFPILSIAVIVSLFITKLESFYAVMFFEYIILVLIYPMDDAYHSKSRH
ncbi:MAG: hypothetical protein AB7U79_08790 [Candidatus Izemoplasmatales bacterium]